MLNLIDESLNPNSDPWIPYRNPGVQKLRKILRCYVNFSDVFFLQDWSPYQFRDNCALFITNRHLTPSLSGSDNVYAVGKNEFKDNKRKNHAAYPVKGRFLVSQNRFQSPMAAQRLGRQCGS